MNNFLQWNPSKVNQEDDTEYAVDSQRLGGADLEELFPSETANKLFYQVTTMVAGIGQMMSNKGYTMSDANFANLVTALANILTKADFGDAAGTVCQGNDPRLGSFAAGTRAWFGNISAPTGWTIDPAAADGLLAARGGTNAYAAAAGGQAGTWTQPSHLHTGPSHTHTGPSHTHTGPNHYHAVANHTHAGTGLSGSAHYHKWYDFINDATVADKDGYGQNLARANVYAPDMTTGGYFVKMDYARRHDYEGQNQPKQGPAMDLYTSSDSISVTGSTASGGTGNTGASATAATWRPLANLGNVCIKS